MQILAMVCTSFRISVSTGSLAVARRCVKAHGSRLGAAVLRHDGNVAFQHDGVLLTLVRSISTEVCFAVRAQAAHTLCRDLRMKGYRLPILIQERERQMRRLTGGVCDDDGFVSGNRVHALGRELCIRKDPDFFSVTHIISLSPCLSQHTPAQPFHGSSGRAA